MEDDQGQYESPSEKGHHDHNNNINPWEDEGSLATGDTNRNNTNQRDDGSRGLRIKIKKGNNNNSESEEAHNKKNNEQHLLRVCHICNKGFNTGKALGGHMRMHALSSNQAHNKAKNNTTTCYLCRKSFFSMQALFGHMRSHPERVWRGIQPPLSTITTNHSAAAASSNSTSSSSTLSHDSAIDLSSALRGWSVTAKRGRKNLSCDTSLNLGVGVERHRMVEGVYELMLLARGDPKTVIECKDTTKMKRKLSGSVDDQVLEFEDKLSLNKMGNDEEEDSDSQNSDGSIVGFDMENRNKNSNKKKKGTKKMKLNEIGKAEEGNKLDAVAANRYRCSICNKSFPSYQALGGHLSHHKKSKNIQSMDNELESDDVSASEDQEEKQEHHAKTTTTMHADETKTVVEHALGCCSSTVENGQNCPKILSFDLNQPPAMDEDEDIQLDLFIPTNMVPSSYYASTSQNSVTNC